MKTSTNSGTEPGTGSAVSEDLRPWAAVRGSWADLVSAALVGTDRRAFVPDPAIGAGTDPAQALVRQAMSATIPALTGVPPTPYEGAPPEPAPADDRPLIPRAAQLRLRAVLDVYPKYLGEWLAAVQDSGCRLPSSALPGLLDAGRSQVQIRGVLAQVLGARGHWLARHNPDWRYLLREPVGALRPEDWDGPDPDARIAYANGLYAADPAAARALFEAAWPTLTAAVKTALLALVARHGTGNGDIRFVSGLSQDSSKQVREEAASVETRLRHQRDHRRKRSPEELTAEAEKLAADGFNGEVHRFATQYAHLRWPLDASRTILAILVGYSREEVPGAAADRAAANRHTRDTWAADQVLGVLGDCAPLELRPDVERVVEAQHADIAAGAVYHLDFSALLTPLGFRADMHAELTASADAVPGQE